MYSVVASRIGLLILSLKDWFPSRSKLGKINIDIWDQFPDEYSAIFAFVKQKCADFCCKVLSRWSNIKKDCLKRFTSKIRSSHPEVFCKKVFSEISQNSQ